MFAWKKHYAETNAFHTYEIFFLLVASNGESTPFPFSADCTSVLDHGVFLREIEFKKG